MLEPRSFSVYMNTAILIIAMLDHSKVNTEISDVGMKTTESNNCREVLKDDEDTNNVLAAI